MNYPSDRKDRHFGIKYLKWLCNSGVAEEIGPDALALLTAIVTKEDEFHYERAPNFFNDQLATRCGIPASSKHALIRARQRAIDAGLLEYEPGAKRRPGRYFVLAFSVESATNNNLSRTESAPNLNTSKPLPSTSPKRTNRPKFVVPTLDEVEAYCLERKNSVNAERFIDHYTANGWVQSSGQPILDWKAAVRTWEKNQFNDGASMKPKAKPDIYKVKVPAGNAR